MYSHLLRGLVTPTTCPGARIALFRKIRLLNLEQSHWRMRPQGLSSRPDRLRMMSRWSDVS